MQSDVKGYQDSIRLISQQWEEVKEDLYNEVVKYDDLQKLKNNYIFFNRFDDMFKETSVFFEVNLSDIKNLYRGVVEELDLNNYERMIPKIEFAKGNNRMNPPGKAFLYLGILGNEEGKEYSTIKKHVVKTVLKETRAPKNVIATICKFEINSSAKNKKIIDIRGNSNIPTSSTALAQYICKNTITKDTESRTQKISEIMASVYINIFSSDQIFKPINTKKERSKKFEYGPFHAIANYMSEQGYAGLIYKSTVHQNGTNLVLFNPNDASVISSSMEHISTSEYL